MTFIPRKVRLSLKKGIWKEVRSNVTLTVQRADIGVSVRGTHAYRLANGKRITFYDFGGDKCSLTWNERTKKFNPCGVPTHRVTAVQAPQRAGPADLQNKKRGCAHLTWKPPSESGLVGFNVYRTIDTIPPHYQRLNNYLVHTLWYDDYNVESGKTYRYFVTSVDTLDCVSDPSKEMVIHVP